MADPIHEIHVVQVIHRRIQLRAATSERAREEIDQYVRWDLTPEHLLIEDTAHRYQILEHDVDDDPDAASRWYSGDIFPDADWFGLPLNTPTTDKE